MKEFPQIFAFYSFKGGVGRSMAVLNLAYALAAKGRHVLVLDMDLEAPGLSGFLHRAEEITGFARLDMVDLVGWASSACPPIDPLSFPTLSDCVVSIPREKLEPIPRTFSEFGRLDIIPVEEERNYYDRLWALDLRSLDQDALVRIGSILRAWLKSLRFPIDVPDYYGPDCDRTAPYDYVLVDSRTGITEIGGLCIGPLSDQLVVLSALNDQNVVGTRKFLEEVGVLKNDQASGSESRSKPYLIVASLLPVGEIKTKQDRLIELEKALGKAPIRLSYHPQLALKETIFVRVCRDEYLAREYEELVQQVLGMADDRDDPARTLAVFNLSRASADFRDVLRRLARSASGGPMPLLLHLLATNNFEEVSNEDDFILWDRVCRVLSSEESQFQLDVYVNWANLLSRWGLHSTDHDLGELRLETARSRYEQILESDKASSAQRALTLFNRAVTYANRGKPEQAIADYAALIEMPDAPTERKAQSLVNRGVIFGQQGEPERAIADFTAVIRMPDAPDNQRALALLNRGTRYGQRDEPEEAIADFTTVIDMPDVPPNQKAQALYNRGWWHFVAGRYQEAINDERQALPLNPDDFRAHGNLAIALLVLGETSDSLTTYDAALALADVSDLDEMTKDLHEAIEKHGQLHGAEEVMGRLEARRQALTQQATNKNGGTDPAAVS